MKNVYCSCIVGFIERTEASNYENLSGEICLLLFLGTMIRFDHKRALERLSKKLLWTKSCSIRGVILAFNDLSNLPVVIFFFCLKFFLASAITV